MLQEKQATFATNIAHLILYANKLGFEVTFGDVKRSKEQQAIYVDAGFSQTMNSKHLDSLAADLYFFYHSSKAQLTEGQNLHQIGSFWCKLHPNNRAGMFWHNFIDKNHFEML